MNFSNQNSFDRIKILEIGGYPPPNTGWSVRIKFLKEGFCENGDDCKILNLNRNRKIKSPHYIDVQSGLDYILKLIRYRLSGYVFHAHTNAQAIKGPILILVAQIVTILTGKRAALTFHGGIEQLYFPKHNAGIMHGIILLNFILSKIIICNHEQVKKEICSYGPLVDGPKVFSIPAFSIQYLKHKPIRMNEQIDSFIKSKKHVILCYIILRNGFYVGNTVKFMQGCPHNVGFILTGIGTPEDNEVSGYLDEIEKLQSEGVALVVNDMDHDMFMSMLAKCTLYLRTPTSDGVASSVLEALSLKIPVVASDNGRRPESVVCYDPNDVEDLINKTSFVLDNYAIVKQSLRTPAIRDTLKEELTILKRSLS